MKKLVYIFFPVIFLTLPFFAFGEADLSLTISPLINKIEVEPGGSRSGILQVFNMGSREVEATASVLDFEGGYQGHVNFFSREEMEERREEISLGSWMSVDEDPFLIPPGEGRTVHFRIDVPEDAEPGGKYASVLVTTGSPERDSESTGIDLAAGVGSLFLVNVEGDVIEKAVLRDFFTEDLFYRGDEISFRLGVENPGTVHIQPRGEIRIYDYGGRRAGAIDVNRITDFGNVLPGTERSWDFTWNKKNDIMEAGRYKAVLFLEYGRDRSEIYKEINFWVLPVTRRGAVMVLILSGLFFALVGYRLVEIYGKEAFKK